MFDRSRVRSQIGELVGAAPLPWEGGTEGKEFWADQIKRLRDNPRERLELALANLPLPAAFREAAIACRALVRSKRKGGESFEEILELLYWLAALDSFSMPYASRLHEPGFNVFSSIPWEVLFSLEFTYETLGFEKLDLLNKNDRKWLVTAWGEPSAHLTLHELQRHLWNEYEDRLIDARIGGRGITRDQYIQEQREIHAQVAAEIERERRQGRTYTLGVVGEAQKNEDGTDRQKIIKRCRTGERLILQREPENPYDANAVAVLRHNGEKIGYLSRRNAAWVAEVMDREVPVTASIHSIRKVGPLFRRKRGVIIHLTKH